MIKFKTSKNQEGSALVMTIIVLVNALLIVTTITAISVIEQKTSSKTKNSTPAYQAADSAMEWALKRLQDTTLVRLDELCPGGFDAHGKCDPSIVFPDPNTITEIYFVDVDGAVITNGTQPPSTAVSMRTVGRYGDGEDRVSRALEVHLGQSGPIAWWPFSLEDRDSVVNGGTDDAQADEVDELIHANIATVNDGQWTGWGTGTGSNCLEVEDTCIEFDGAAIPDPYAGSAANFAQAPDVAPVYQIENGTVSLWFKAEDLSSDQQSFFSKEEVNERQNHLTISIADSDSYWGTPIPLGHGKVFPIPNQEYIAVRFQENTGINAFTGLPDPDKGASYIILSDTPINVDTWYFVAFTFGSNGMRLYIAEEGDPAGVVLQADNDAFTGGFRGPPGVDNTEPIVMGADAQGKTMGDTDPLGHPFDGFMDDVRIYGYQMNLTQIDALFGSGPS